MPPLPSGCRSIYILSLSNCFLALILIGVGAGGEGAGCGIPLPSSPHLPPAHPACDTNLGRGNNFPDLHLKEGGVVGGKQHHHHQHGQDVRGIRLGENKVFYFGFFLNQEVGGEW